jgi:hypothetical protein
MRDQPDPLRCLDCSRPLTDAEPVDNAPESRRCVCGLVYTEALLQAADHAKWERVRLARTFLRDGDTMIVWPSSSDWPKDGEYDFLEVR